MGLCKRSDPFKRFQRFISLKFHSFFNFCSLHFISHISNSLSLFCCCYRTCTSAPSERASSLRQKSAKADKVRAIVPNDRVARALSSFRAAHNARTRGAHTGQLQSRGTRARVSTTRRPVARQESHFGFVFVVRFFSLTLAFLSAARSTERA